jgi:hypothetical protein
VQVEGSCFVSRPGWKIENQAVNGDAQGLVAWKPTSQAEALQKSSRATLPALKLRCARRVVLGCNGVVAAALAQELKEMAVEMKQGLTETSRKAKHYQTYLAHHSRKDYKKD